MCEAVLRLAASNSRNFIFIINNYYKNQYNNFIRTLSQKSILYCVLLKSVGSFSLCCELLEPISSIKSSICCSCVVFLYIYLKTKAAKDRKNLTHSMNYCSCWKFNYTQWLCGQLRSASIILIENIVTNTKTITFQLISKVGSKDTGGK